MRTIYTIGHSSHTAENFLALLQQYCIEVLVDTRSALYSRYSPQFDRETLRDAVTTAGIKYLYLGDVVGGRPKDECHYDDQGRARYGKMGKDAEFLSGIERLERGAGDFRVALMCSEEDPPTAIDACSSAASSPSAERRLNTSEELGKCRLRRR